MLPIKLPSEFLQKFHNFSLINKEFKSFWDKFDITKIQNNDIRKIYVFLGNLLLQPQHTVEVVVYFRKEFLNILLSAINFDHDGTVCSYKDHTDIFVALAKIIEIHPDAECFTIKYFQKYPAPFEDYGENYPARKKSKIEVHDAKITDLEIVSACYTFLKHSPTFFKNKWKWASFIEKFYTHKLDMVKWICYKCLQITAEMNEAQFNTLLSKNLSESSIRECTIQYELSKSKSEEHVSQLDTKYCSEELTSFEISKNVVCISGTYLPVYQEITLENTFQLVEVESTKINLQKVALGVATNKAVCLQGPVGSGKTFFIEYLAAKTGRVLGESFIKVQLGDQTDSKMLLGTYRCTDVPGEFVWQPGVLTQAVLEGSWVLLEDIDLANMDIVSVLTALLENGSLTVPGYRDSIPIAPGFQLFVTQRLVRTATGYHKKHTNILTLLEKNVLQINIDPLSPSELIQIIQTVFPDLKTIASRMVDTFLLFSTSSSKSGRLISTRDLFKWCSRATTDFDVTSQDSALNVLQDAIDIFCCAYLNTEERLSLACEISTRLGIISEKADYFCNRYKPTLSLTTDSLKSGRVFLQKYETLSDVRLNFCFTRPSACLLERIMCCVNLKEPVLLVGETGTGKTSAIQYLAHTLGLKLIVINMNQQSDSADLLGGYKPVDLKFIMAPIKREFENVFSTYFSINHNKKFLSNIEYCFNEEKWNLLIKLMRKSYEAAMKRLTEEEKGTGAVVTGGKRAMEDEEQQKTKKKEQSYFLNTWTTLGIKLQKLEIQLKHKNALAFAFIEGSLVKAVENGYWVLLDEINLANAETLECLSGLLEGTTGTLSLLERGDKKPIKRHQQFTLFACMNPSTDVGKRDLPAGLRNRFTEFFVDELTDKSDLLLLVNSYLNAVSLPQEKLESIVKFYLGIRKEAQLSLSDGLGHKPHFSLRTLCRALTVAARNPCGVFKRSLYEAFCLSFLTQLDTKSYKTVEGLIVKHILGNTKDAKGILKQAIPEPKPEGCSHDYLQFEGYWVSVGDLEPEVPNNYVLTDSVRRNLKDLVRVVSIGKSPVLLQGDTSVGKTSLITYLAKSSGNKCVRINNHEHTDLQEYIGSYVADVNGKLVFREGLLVEAMRKGHWIILDELNLAPTDVLEALNRVLDDNRELFIPETQETVKAHPNFMLFATQNPPGVYGGRKMLSRAFRNRFVELHFNEIPPPELEFILHKRCEMPPSYAKKMVAVMTDLQTRRRGSAAFAGKHGFITLRDLFRWGERYRQAQERKSLYDWDQHLADEGYLLLAGRVRKVEERNEIAGVLQKHMKREVVPYNLFTLTEKTSRVTKHILENVYKNKDKYKNIVWTYNMRQLAVLVAKALEFHEPVLLVGETGGGKTTVCKLIAENNNQALFTVNCHMHTESSDFIGGLRPVRDHSDDDLNRLFEWVDGPLIQAMVKGGVFLADEISLADDSVLERLNSLLEPERSLLLAEKGSDLNNPDNSELIAAHCNFHFIGTMNPGGDYGKKELSPALRNRFTEIWCDSCTERNDLVEIIERNVVSGVSLGNQEDGRSGIGRCIMDFIEWFKGTDIGKRFTTSIRDILTWVNFINASADKSEVADAYLHGACLTFLDSFGSGVTSTESSTALESFRRHCMSFIIDQLTTLNLEPSATSIENLKVEIGNNKFGIKPFYISLGSSTKSPSKFTFEAPTCSFNTLRLLRGLQLNKAILLEGSPGVGKTSLVTAIAKATQNHILRINLSDQTDISDLFGADLPVEGGTGGQFAWRDGPFLQALRNGHWILLDELNLASQSVLEGLNACLDHRGEIFIPELGKTFHVKPGTRLFACQNPLKQGGSRRGLPQSFLNRFTQVYIDPLNAKDLLCILIAQFSTLPKSTVVSMIDFNSRIVSELEQHTFGHKGAPWEFNLRDLTRWCETVLFNSDNNTFKPENFVQLIYGDRMRTLKDKKRMREIFEDVFGRRVGGVAPVVYVTETVVHAGDVCLNRQVRGVNVNVLKRDTCLVLRNQVPVLRSLVYCVNLNWMAILVGSSGTGKSSVVRTLASLSGKTLHTLPVTSAMDTTDILGGFEQTDYTRHLEEIIRQTESLLLEIVQECLLKGDHNEGIQILRMWEAFSTLISTATSNRTMAEETQFFLKKLQSVSEILKYLLSHSTVLDIRDRLKCLQQKEEKISEAVKKEGNLNAGGKFEWVDSILIKCLRDGSWLLIDNVNLCSPAVLDRLNALLEPNGVLTIGERGVNENGEMIEIKPHKDFRLFLTMDPKNGEISRAMRNRGIEIYMLNENKNGDMNCFDIKSLIDQAGLKKNKYIEVLLKMHQFISDIVLGEKPNINHLLQASFLISQQLLRGKDVFLSFCHAVIDVYYKSRSPNEFDSNDALNLIQDELKNLLFVENKGLQIQCYDADVTLKTSKLARNSGIEKIKQQGVCLQKCITHEPLLRHFLINYYSITSPNDLKMRYEYAQKCIVSIREHTHVEEISKLLLENLLENLTNENLDVPQDFHWLADSTFKTNTSISNSNKLYLMMYFISSKMLSEGEVNENLTKSKELSLLRFLNGVRAKKIEGKIDDILENDLLNLLDIYDRCLLECLKMKRLQMSDKQVIEIVSLLQWRFILHHLTITNIQNLNLWEYKNIIVNLHVHYRWFYKFSVKQLFKVLDIKIHDNLTRFVNRINASADHDFSVQRKIAKHFQKNIHKPPPLINNTQVEVYKEFQKISENLDLYSRQNDFMKILRIVNDQKLRAALIKTKTELSYEFFEIPESFSQLKEMYCTAIKEVSSDYKPGVIEMLPVYDHFVRLAIIKLKCQLHYFQENQNMLVETLTVPPNLLSLLTRYNQTQDVRLMHELKSEVFYYLLNAASIAAFKFHDFDAVVEVPLAKKFLPHFAAALSVLVSDLIVSDVEHKETLRMTSFGNYRNVIDQNRTLNLLLWRNLQQISNKDYDFVYWESNYLRNSYHEFIKQLFVSLTVTSIDEILNLNELTELCIEKIEELYKNSEIDDINGDKNSLVLLLKQCLGEVNKLNTNEHLNKQLKVISNIYFLLNYLKVLLNSRLPTIDPLLKIKLKKQYCLKQIQEFTCINQSYELQNEVYSGFEETLHSHVGKINDKIKDLKTRDLEFGKYIAVRPENVTYTHILKEISHHFAMFLTPQQISKLFTNLNNCFESIQGAVSNKTRIDVQNYEKHGQEFMQYICGYENLIDLMKKYRYSYPDIVEPLLSNVTEFLYAIRLKTNLHCKLLIQYNNMEHEIDLNKDLVKIMSVPTLCSVQTDYIKAIALYTDRRMQDFVTKMLQSEDNQHLYKQENFRLLKCGIRELYNVSVLDGDNCKILDKKLFMEFDALLNTFVKAWKQQEEELELKRKEEESLYKIKPKSESKEIEEHFNELFPSFHDKDFSDLQVKTLEDDKAESLIDLPSRYVGVITKEDVKFVSKMHAQLLQLYTKTEWLNPAKQSIECDFVTPLIDKCKLFKLLLNKYGECLDYTLDAEILNSLNLLVAVAHHFGDVRIFNEQNSDSPRTQIKRRYDFYKDSRVEEVKGSYHILEELRLKIGELLNEWPEHPTLQTINTIISRIYNFDITSPLSRFLTGFEILLSKCHEWEQNAHAGVSLIQYTQNLIQQIIAWRKIEMNMWKDSLNNAFDGMNEPISKWWFYIYEIMLQFTQENACTSEELISTLQKFITQSNLAEFANRLDLLMTFHCHAVQLPRIDKSGIFVNVLWNVHEYFKQFIPNVENKIKELRSPIEKKLKEYVKIVKWKDISYWAVKETLEKTHKNLHKYIREFQDVLKQPVTPCLTNTSSRIKPIENIGIWDRPQRHLPKMYHYTMDPVTYMAKRSLSKKMQFKTDESAIKEETILKKAEKYFYKSRVLCKDAMLATKYPSLIQALDGFVGDVIDASDRLQKLEVDTTLPKDKQRSQAKGILQQKRKALADLFKALSTIGLSFRTGIIHSKIKDTSKQFLIRPIDLRAAFQHINYSRNDEKLLTIWDGCQMYYTRALLRLDTLDTSLKNPAKDLGIQNAERCKGFSEHLMGLVHEQKSKLVETSRILYYLRFYSTSLAMIYEQPAHISTIVYNEAKEFLKNTLTVMEQYKIILHTCPDEVYFGNELCSIPILKPENENFPQYMHDTHWKNCVEQITGVISTSKKLLMNLEKFRNNVPSTEFELAHPTQIPISDADSIIKELDIITSKLKKVTSIFGNIPVTNSIIWLEDEAHRIKNILTEHSETTEAKPAPLNLEQFKKSTEKMFEKMLVAMQNIYKKYKLTEKSGNENTENVNPEEEEDVELKPDHLKTLVIDDLSQDMDVLEMCSTLKVLHSLILEFYNAKWNDISEFKTVLSQILPLLEQVVLLYQYFVTQQVSAYRVTCKMSSVLSNIFIELVTKGFCVPPEFSEEFDSEGQSQQAGGGLGLGEGEGQRDVSDRIESEDQLEDAQPAGKEKEKPEDKDCKEEEKGIEMSEDFDSKLQDVEKGEDDQDDDNKSDSNDDADEQMGETETGADQLDQQIWGSDNEDANESGDEEEEKEGSGSKGEKEGEDELAAKENNQPKEDHQQDQSTDDSKEKSKKEINEMDEPELDDEQIDPYHGNQPEYPEPEMMDLPEDLELDDDMQDKDETPGEENPFDIDTMKEQMPPAPTKDEEDKKAQDDTKENEPEDIDSSDDEPDVKEKSESNMETEEGEEEQAPGTEQNEDLMQNATEKTEEDKEKDSTNNEEQSAVDQTQTDENEVQAMDMDDIEASDNVKTNLSENQKSAQANEQVCQEDNPDKEGVGQSRMEESKTGHKGKAAAQDDTSSNRQEEEMEHEMKRKPGESNSKRSLGDKTESIKKKLKTIDIQQSEPETENEESTQERQAEMYQHIEEAKDTDDQILDTATKEQAERQKEVPDLKNEEEKEETKECSEYVPENEEDEKLGVSESVKQKAEKVESEKKKSSDKGQHPEGDILEELQDVEVEGDVVKTTTVPRGGETSHYTQYSNLHDSTIPQLTIQEINQIRTEVEQQLSVWNEPPTSNEAEQAWEKISSVTSSLAQSLSEQLRLVLEPTQASRLKGDYRTGRRINMRKVIPYIASQFRKDKIWLRRTKPSKREYQIALAIDDSSSMSDNHSKELAFESVALISKALTLLESGQLSVLSFGESTEVLHKLTDTFTEKSGSKLLQRFQFTQKKTCVAKLVDFVSEMLTSAHLHSNALIAKLLIIVSDGRGIFSEGESYVQQAVRRAKLSNIFMVFVIIDNPENKDSILDIRMPVFKDGKLLGIKSYMDSFPFPFYIILRDINSLPSVLSDALRQWFEIVSNIDKQ